MMRIRSAAWLPLVGLLAGLVAAQTPPVIPARQQTAPLASWLHEGSDIPADPAWVTGVLPNGLRYAVRRNATPPGTVAIRVRIDAGALMESPDESGWAHLLEHMVFRGTPTQPDGAAIKLWQRLGASFGSDTNAFTSLRSTTYVLDLPRSDAASVGDAVGTLSDMLRNAAIDPKLLDIERKVVIAERAMRLTPVVRKVREATRTVLQAGLLASDREIAGTDASLTAASADRLRAFHRRWYRPERAVVVIAGDIDPAAMVDLIARDFGGWKGAGKPPAEPAYGSPTEPDDRIAMVADPNASAGMQLSWITPHQPGVTTAARQRADFLDMLAIRVLNQRLSEQALKGGAMLSAGAGVSRQRSLADTVSLGINTRGEAWQDALAEAYGVLNRTLAGPIEQAEIDQQVAVIGQSLNRSIETSQTWTSAALANAIVSDVDTADVAATPRYYADSFAAQVPSFTPAAVGAALRTLFAPRPRFVMISRVDVPGGEATVTAALDKARQAAGGAATAIRTVSLDQISPPLTPGTVARERPIAEFGIDRVDFANGVELVMKKTAFARESIRVEVRIGAGTSGRPVGSRVPDWSSTIVQASGLGGATPPELARLAAGRQIGFAFGNGSDATLLSTTTNPKDLADAMRTMLAGVTRFSVDPVAVTRFRSAYQASLRTIFAQPQSVLGVMGMPVVYGNDARFLPLPPPREVAATDAAAIRAYWEGALGSAPIRVAVVGDFDREAVIRAVAATFGALPARTVPAKTAVEPIPPAPTDKPLLLTHRGDPNQAMVALAWRTTGGVSNIRDSRTLGVAATILRDRLTDDFREQQGGTYSPFVNPAEVRGFDGFGTLMAGAQLTPDKIPAFRATLDRIVADLAANGPSEDSLVRARETAVGAAQRALSGNVYWSAVAASELDDPRQRDAIRTYISGREAIDAGAVRDVVRRYLAGGTPLVIEIRPAPTPSAPVTTPAPPSKP